MPGKWVLRRVILIKIGLAVLLGGLCAVVPARAGANGGTYYHISQIQANVTPPLATPNSPRKTPPIFVNTRPSHHPAYQGLLKFMAGGLLGGLLCSLLFGYPASLFWSQGYLPFGFLDVVALSAAAYVGYRLLRPVGPKEAGIAIPGFPMPESVAPAVFTINNDANPGLAKCFQTDTDTQVAHFVEYARLMIFDLHEAWNHEDLDKVKDRVTPQLQELLGMGLTLLNLRGEISRVEDLALTHIVVVMARQDDGRDVIAVSFQGQVVDYLLERRSFKLISGSMTYPERLQECWIFERQGAQSPWLLADIQDSRFFWENQAA